MSKLNIKTTPAGQQPFEVTPEGYRWSLTLHALERRVIQLATQEMPPMKIVTRSVSGPGIYLESVVLNDEQQLVNGGVPVELYDAAQRDPNEPPDLYDPVDAANGVSLVLVVYNETDHPNRMVLELVGATQSEHEALEATPQRLPPLHVHVLDLVDAAIINPAELEAAHAAFLSVVTTMPALHVTTHLMVTLAALNCFTYARAQGVPLEEVLQDVRRMVAHLAEFHPEMTLQ